MPSTVCKKVDPVKKKKKTTTPKKKPTTPKKKTTAPKRTAAARLPKCKPKASPKTRRRKQPRRACRRSCHVGDFDIPLQFAQMSTPVDELAQNIQLAQQTPGAATPETPSKPADVLLPGSPPVAIDGADQTAHKNIRWEGDADGEQPETPSAAPAEGEDPPTKTPSEPAAEGEDPPTKTPTAPPAEDDTPAPLDASGWVEDAKALARMATDVKEVFEKSPYLTADGFFGAFGRKNIKVRLVRDKHTKMKDNATSLASDLEEVRVNQDEAGIAVIEARMKATYDEQVKLSQQVENLRASHNNIVYRLHDMNTLYEALNTLDPEKQAQERKQKIEEWETQAGLDIRNNDKLDKNRAKVGAREQSLGTTTSIEVGPKLTEVIKAIVEGCNQKQDNMYVGTIKLWMTKDCSMTKLDPVDASRRCGLTGVRDYVYGTTMLDLPENDMLLWTANSRWKRGADNRYISFAQNIVMSIRDLISALQAKPRAKPNATMFILLPKSIIWLSIQPIVLKDEQLQRLQVVLAVVENLPEELPYLESIDIMNTLLKGYLSVSIQDSTANVWKRDFGVSMWVDDKAIEDGLQTIEGLANAYIGMVDKAWATTAILEALAVLTKEGNDVEQGAADDGEASSEDISDDEEDTPESTSENQPRPPNRKKRPVRLPMNKKSALFLLGLYAASAAGGNVEPDAKSLIAIGKSASPKAVKEVQNKMGDNLRRRLSGGGINLGGATLSFVNQTFTPSGGVYNLNLSQGTNFDATGTATGLVDDFINTGLQNAYINAVGTGGPVDDVPMNSTPPAVDPSGNPINTAVEGTELPIGGDMNGPAPNPSQVARTAAYVEPQPDIPFEAPQAGEFEDV